MDHGKWMDRLTRINLRLGTIAAFVCLILLAVLVLRFFTRGVESFGWFEIGSGAAALASIVAWARDVRAAKKPLDP